MSNRATESETKPPRRWWKYVFVVAGVGLAGLLALSYYVTTQSFQSLVRRRLVAEIERITGGRAEVGTLHTVPFHMQVEVRNITVHGKESSTDVPLAHADAIIARMKITSLLRSELAFDEVVLEQPIIHLAFYPDGTTNFPSRATSTSARTSIEKLFDLSIDRLESRNGRLLWDDQQIPLEFNARDTWLDMDYSYLHSRYNGRLLLGMVDTKLPNLKPFAWMGSADFHLSSDAVDFSSLKWNSGHSNVSVTGQVTNFRRPTVQANYNAHVDLAEAASIARRIEVRAGSVEVKGQGNWSLDRFASSGLISLRDFAWQDNQVTFSKASAESGYTVSDQQLKLSKLQARIFGGSVSGDAEINQWLAVQQHLSPTVKKGFETAVISAAPPLTKRRAAASNPKPTAIQAGRISLRMRDISVEELAIALNAPGHPIRALQPAGLTSGTLETRWTGSSRDAEVQFALDVVPPARLNPAERPITAHTNGSYYAANDSINLPKFELSTPASHIQASGTLSSTSAVRLSVSTTSLADWLPFVAAVRGPALFPVFLNGHAAFNGNLTGSFLSPQLAGSLVADDFDVNFPGVSPAHPLKTHWDSFSTSLQLSSGAVGFHNSTIRRDTTSAEFDASSTLQAGHVTNESAFNLRASLHDADVETMQALVGYHYPITGNGDLLLQASGTVAHFQADGQIHVADVTAYGEAIPQFDSSVHYVDGELAFDNVHLFYDDSIVAGSAAYNPATRAYRLDLRGNNFDLAHIRQVQASRLQVDGQADFAIRSSGTADAPSISGTVQIHNLALDHEPAGDLQLEATTENHELRFTGTSHLQRGSIAIGGNVQLRDDYVADLSFHFEQLDLDALWHSYVGEELTGHSAVGGAVSVHGPIRHPLRWAVDGDLSALAIEVEQVQLHNQDPIRFTLANRALEIQQLHMVGEGTDLAAHGSVQLSGDRRLDLEAEGHADLKLISGFDSDIAATGLVTLNMTIGGSVSDPRPQGRVEFSNGTLAYTNIPSGLSDLNGSLSFTRDHFQINSLTAHTGGGTLDFKGDASYLDGQFNFSVSASGKDVRLRYPPGVSSTANADLRWTGTKSNSTVSGEIVVNKIAVTPGFDFSSYLQRGRTGSGVIVGASPLNNVKLDIRVETSPELQMRTAIARLSGDADLRLRGSVARPAVLGRVDVLEGQATFHGTRFTLERGDITFANPVSIEPQLNLQASTHVRNYDLNITVTGTPDRGLNINYRSEPPLPKSDIIALLALGRTGDESTQLQEQSGQSAFSDQATALILSQALNTTVSSRLERIFGASNIKIDPQGLTTETNPTGRGPQVSIEQEFANNISLTYSTNVSQNSQQIIEGEYYINRNLSILGTRDQNGVVSFDLQIRQRKK